MVTPGSVGDWMQALIMAAALAGLAATWGRRCGRRSMRCQGGRNRHDHPAVLSVPPSTSAPPPKVTDGTLDNAGISVQNFPRLVRRWKGRPWVIVG